MRKSITLFTFLSFSMFLNAQIFSEDFEGGILPEGWTNESLATDGGWLVGDSTSQSSSEYNFPEHTLFIATNDDACNCDKLLERLITPIITLPADEGTVLLSLEYSFLNGDYQGINETAKIIIKSGDVETEIVEFEGGTRDWIEFSYNLHDYLGQNIQLIFEYSDGGGWNYAYGIDDIRIDFFTGAEGSLASIDNEYYYSPGEIPVIFSIENTGSDEITSAEITYYINGVPTTESFSGSILFGTTQQFTSTGLFAVVADQNTELSVSLTSINGSENQVGFNDSLARRISGIGEFPQRTVVIEEGTGTSWCAWCPRGAVYRELIEEEHPESSLIIAVHVNDPMEVVNYSDVISAQISGYPSGLVDRALGLIDPDQYPSAYTIGMLRQSIIDLSESSAVISDNTLSVSANATFLAGSSDEYRFSVVVIEDSVTGTSVEYAQANEYSGGEFGEMGGYENLPNPVPASQMIYNDVARALLGGWNGQPNSIPFPVVGGENYSYAFEWTIPEGVDISNLTVGVLVIDQTTGIIDNSIEIPTQIADGIFETYVSELKVYPNPAADITLIEMELLEASVVHIQIMSSLGQIVYSDSKGNLPSGKQIFNLDVADYIPGLYLITIQVGNEKVTRRIAIK
jgi:hypothetical protein